ncbi:MAG: hypothetical protein K2M36_00550, partial [Clostridia bacterium]|nr:hypothetical protein [Clostridia bacterium]
PSVLLGGEKQVYSFTERAHALEMLGLDNLIYTNFDDYFAHHTALDFLDTLTFCLNIKAIVVGEDYRFGKNAEGNVTFLEQYCVKNDILLKVVPFRRTDGRKISTSELKNLVKSGDIKHLNSLLTQPYFTIGKVEHARHVGSTVLGYPTANIAMDDSKLALAEGIYATKLYVDCKCYNSMTNVGAKPTFYINTPSIETFIFDFDGDLYGKQVKLSFFERTRGVIKFPSADALKEQLKADEAHIRASLSQE